MDIVFGIGKIPLFKIIRSILDTVQNMLFPLCLSGEACGLVVQSAQLLLAYPPKDWIAFWDRNRDL